MEKHTKAFLAGIGSIMAIYPSVSYSDYVPNESAEERIRNCWVATGAQLRLAITQYDEQQDDETQQEKK